MSYNSNAGGATEYGNNWEATYHRFVEVVAGGVNVQTPQGMLGYSSPDANNNYIGSPNHLNNTLNGSATIGWTETQPDGTNFNYDTSGFLRTIRNNAGVRWTLTWNAGFTLVQHIDGPLGRRTSFTYDGSNNIRRIQDPSGRITSLSVNSSSNLVRIVTPELCTTSLVYNTNNAPTAWIDPLGNRTTYLFDGTSASSVKAVVQPLGQRTTFLSLTSPVETVVVYPTLARTTITLFGNAWRPKTILNAVGNQTSYAYVFTTMGGVSSAYLSQITDGRGNLTTISYQPRGTGRTAIYPTAIQSPIAQYQYRYNANNQLAAVIDEIGNRSSLVWDSQGNRIAVIDPYNQRTSYVYDSMARLVAVKNALGLRATQLYDSQGRLSADINPLGLRVSYAYDPIASYCVCRTPWGTSRPRCMTA